MAGGVLRSLIPDQGLVDPGNRWEATDIYNLNSGAITSSFPPSNFLLLSPHLILTLGLKQPTDISSHGSY